MFWGWVKKYMPRGLYGRAALILLLPVVFIQLLVSVVFVQRHFDGVTRSMTGAIAIELRYIRDAVEAAPSQAAARAILAQTAAPLEITAQIPSDPPAQDLTRWDDLTGNMVRKTLRDGLPQVTQISLAQRDLVAVWFDSKHGPVALRFARGRVSASNPHQLLVIMVVLGALMTLISYFFLRNQLRPIMRMAKAAADYGKGRITPFTPTGAVEVRAAGMAFLDMRQRIERQSQSRIMMLSGISHDLRTPLTRLRLGLSMLDDAEAALLIADVDEMKAMLDEFLIFSRDDAGDQLTMTDPRAIVDGVFEDATRAGHAITLGDVAAPGDAVSLRPAAVRRALENLIGNARRYGSVTRLSLYSSDRTIRFCVEDDGPGIPEASREAAMSPFVRLDPARNQDKGSGVGLGLSIVADVARNHGGLLRLAQSEDLGGLKATLVLAR